MPKDFKAWLYYYSWLALVIIQHGNLFGVSGFAELHAPLRRCSTTQQNAVVPGSSLELVEPETGCEVVLVGCFHGSKSSADDVVQCLETADTHVVVLELCASRFADMRRDMERDQQGSMAMTRPWLWRFATMIRKTVQNRGLSTGLAAALLGGVSGMQTSLSGLEPGLEFRTAVEQVQTNGGSNRCDIVLADQNVDETLDKVGNLLAISVEMWRTCWTQGWEASFGREASALARAVLGHSDEGSNVEPLNLVGFCTRSPAAIRDMLRLLVPPALMLQVIASGVETAMTWMQQQAPSDETTHALDVVMSASFISSDLTTGATMAFVATNWIILALGYLSVALPASRVILRERDERLAQGIREACHLAVQNGQGRGRVVAVLGLLHVNGIAERLLQQSTSNETPSP